MFAEHEALNQAACMLNVNAVLNNAACTFYVRILQCYDYTAVKMCK